MANFGRIKTWGNEVLEPSDLNAEFDNIINNVTSNGINSANIDETDNYTWSGTSTFTGTFALKTTANAAASVQTLGTLEWDPGDGANLTDNSSGVGLDFKLPDDADNQDVFASINAIVVSDATGAEEGELSFKVIEAGTNTENMTLSSTALTVTPSIVASAGFAAQADSTIYDAQNNADTTLSIGTSATERVAIQALNGAANQTAEEIRFTSYTASATADHGKFSFYVDEAEIATIDDGGINLASGLTYQINGTELIANDANNRVLTATGSGTSNGEANLTFDGSTLTVTGDVAITGNVTKSGHPAFLAKNSVTDSNVTGDGTVVTVDFDTEVFDQGSDFASDTFTAPVTGRYQLNVTVGINGLTTSHTVVGVTLVTSNRTYQLLNTEETAANSSGNLQATGSVLVDMDAADTAYVSCAAYNGTKVVDIAGTAGSIEYTTFSGYLVA